MEYQSQRESREPDWGERALGAIMMGVVAGVLLLLAPGIIFDWALGRFVDSPKGLLAEAIKDGVTWLVSFLFWMAVVTLIVTLYRRRAARLAPVNIDFTTASGAAANEYGQWQQPSRDSPARNGQEEAVPPCEDNGLAGLCTDQACAEALGLSGDLTMEDIRGAYRQRIVEYHPDKVAHLGPKLREVAEVESKRLNVAYQYFEEHYGQAV